MNSFMTVDELIVEHRTDSNKLFHFKLFQKGTKCHVIIRKNFAWELFEISYTEIWIVQLQELSQYSDLMGGSIQHLSNDHFPNLIFSWL